MCGPQQFFLQAGHSPTDPGTNESGSGSGGGERPDPYHREQPYCCFCGTGPESIYPGIQFGCGWLLCCRGSVSTGPGSGGGWKPDRVKGWSGKATEWTESTKGITPSVIQPWWSLPVSLQNWDWGIPYIRINKGW